MVNIGNQIWSSENVKITTFRNGDIIPFVEDENEWANLNSPAYYVTDKGEYLYNYWVVVDERNIAPLGWRIPNKNDWDILINFAGGITIAGNKLKSTQGWEENGYDIINNNQPILYYFNGTDDYGFNAIPVGFRHMDGRYIPSLLSAYFLEESIDEHLAKYVFLFSDSEFGTGGMWKRDGFPIRLIKE